METWILGTILSNKMTTFLKESPVITDSEGCQDVTTYTFLLSTFEHRKTEQSQFITDPKAVQTGPFCIIK